MKRKIVFTTGIFLISSICFAQGELSSETLSKMEFKIIPDKIFELGIPLLFVFLLISQIVSFGKHRAETQLKLKMIEKGFSEEALLKIFTKSNTLAKLQPLKWFLFSVATGLAVLLIFLSRQLITDSTGYFALSVIILLNSIASLIYYKILSKRV